MTWSDALESAIDAVAEVHDPVPLREVRRWLDEPWRIVVIGRVAAGKTTWLNHVAGGDGATGLGGTTGKPREVDAGGRVYVDTPGIDAPDRAIVELQPLVDAADAAVWVVDGLQPLTASERDVARVILGDVQLSVVVTKRDLVDDTDRTSVLARVRDLTSSLEPVSVVFVDAKAVARLPALPGAPAHLSRRRVRMLREAIRATRDAMPARPPGRAKVEELWAQAVRAQVKHVEERIDRDAIRDGSAAVLALAEGAEAARRALRAELPSWLLPVLPGPDRGLPAAPSAGPDPARRAVTAAGARWLADGQLVLREWWAEDPEPARRLARHEAALDALRALEALLPG